MSKKATEASEKRYEKYLVETTDTVFQRSVDIGWDWTELSQMAGVCYSTVYRLGTYQTRFPQLRTLYLLAAAVNMDLPTIKRRVQDLELKDV